MVRALTVRPKVKRSVNVVVEFPAALVAGLIVYALAIRVTKETVALAPARAVVIEEARKAIAAAARQAGHRRLALAVSV